MTQQNTSSIYTAYLGFQTTENFGSFSPTYRRAMAEEVNAFQDTAEKELDVTTRGVYLTTGFRADTDVMFWWIASSPDAIQSGIQSLGRTEFGRHLKPSWSFMGLHRPAEFHRDHSPAFVQRIPPKRTVCVYPFTRTPDWYLLPSDERRDLITAHGQLGRDFGDVLTNTTMGFGLGDDEWVLAFEAEELGRIVDMVRKLRDAEARRYTLREVPFISGVRLDVSDIIDKLF